MRSWMATGPELVARRLTAPSMAFQSSAFWEEA
jgi:hypothetical protein